jgi:hypothetical protein
MSTLRIEMDRGNGWEVRSEGQSGVSLDSIRTGLSAYAIQYPHRAVTTDAVIVAVPRGHPLSYRQIEECHMLAGDNGATIEFL